ncbi:MAG: N-6 DNA methylase, partial [Actinobacteria bacterium]|nr:N-6 DNA methylase [Actinomycetota bacterium]
IKRALAIFASKKSKNYRLSLITIDIELVGSKIQKKISNPKRYSYFLGPDAKTKTPQQFLVEKGVIKDFEDLLLRFNVEVVTKKFFDEFREKFKSVKDEFESRNKAICLDLKDKYSEDDYNEIINKFGFTFLGRLIFVYFLQRKGWIEDNKNYIREYFDNKKNNNLYLNFFTPLFFDVFARKTEDRPSEVKEKFKNTPYLNGGLFEKSKLEEENSLIYLEDKFLRNLIIDFFEIYNFTVDENTINDQEVSIDPEMLGKVFENTLEEKERGKKGTFYTPREIVTFMVKESLLQFLRNETNVTPEALKKFIYNMHLEDLSKSEIRLIDEKLENIKVLDPAVGSGAFPVEMLNILVSLRKKLDVRVGKNINEIELKKQFIRNNLYGVDIDSGAIEIAKLRLWLALIVDYEKEDIEPLPNLDFQFRIGNSLQERVAGFEIVPKDYLYEKVSLYPQSEQLELVVDKKEKYTALQFPVYTASKYLEEMVAIIDKYSNEENVELRKKYKEKFDELENKIFTARIKDLKNETITLLDKISFNKKKEKLFKQKMDEIDKLEKMFKEGIHKLFIPILHFSEVFKQNNGFDIVIGNPPYGVKVDNDIRDWHDLESKDSYGVFISTSLKRFLKQNGVLSFIVSDTWLTIKSHQKLRKHVLEKTFHKVTRLNQDCFDATVNACVISVTNKADPKNEIIAADLTNISARKEADDLREKLYNLNLYIGTSTEKFAVYKYPKSLIFINSNDPIFVGNPKLFKLMNDTTCKFIEKEIGDREKKKVKVRLIEFNGKIIELVRLGDIAEVKQGLATGDNHYYLYQNPEVSGTYKNINDHKDYLLTGEDLEKIRNNEAIRLKVIERGIHKSKDEKNFDPDLWFEGRYIIPYDKGGESDTSSGWLPNYYVPTNYYIDWSTESIKRMKTYKIANRIRDRKENKEITKSYEETNAAVIRNKQYYFKNGLTFSIVGMYSPTFRLGSGAVFDVRGSYIFCNRPNNLVLGVIASKLIKYLFKNFIINTVGSEVDSIKEIPYCIKQGNRISNLVNNIIEKQKQNPRYNYLNNEQKEIDKIIYEIYGLNDGDIKEVESWYERRYPKLFNSLNTSKESM